MANLQRQGSLLRYFAIGEPHLQQRGDALPNRFASTDKLPRNHEHGRCRELSHAASVSLARWIVSDGWLKETFYWQDRDARMRRVFTRAHLLDGDGNGVDPVSVHECKQRRVGPGMIATIESALVVISRKDAIHANIVPATGIIQSPPDLLSHC
jgi:hypothetical protein